MEGHAWVSNSANRKLTRKRSFRNLEKDIKYAVNRQRKTDTLLERKMDKIGQRTRIRTWLTVGILLFSVIGCIAWWLDKVFL